MYGQMHLIIKEMVEELFGTFTWNKIIEKSGLDEEEHFKMFKTYPDDITMALVVGASKTINMPVNGVLQAFGCYFVTWAMNHSFDKMMTSLGGDIISFIENLDSLHSLLSFSYKDITSPSFRCVIEEDDSILLHYYSVRKGLYPIVIGMLETVGTLLYGETCTITFLSEEEEDTGLETKINHIRFRIVVDKNATRVSSSKVMVAHRRSRSNIKHTYDETSRDPGTASIIRSEDFNTAFPYHILLDRSLCIQECGDNIQKLSVVSVKPGTPFKNVATILYPAIAPSINNIFNFINSNFLVGLHRQAGQKPFTLKGQMLWLPHCFHLLFIGSPKLMRLEDFQDMDLFLCDVPMYDVTRELVLLNQQRIAEIDVARKLDEATTELKKVSKEVEMEKQKTEEVLHQMMPHKIASQLTAGLNVPAEKYESCTMLFADIVTFTKIAQKCPADDIVNMLNDIYHRFDMHTDAHNVYKVETIGDAYMAVTGVPEVQDDHAQRMAEFAMDMLEEACFVKSPATGNPIKIRVGLHSGGVVAGVIGKKRPRYDIYGDTVNTASRMESYSTGGRIHLSINTFNLLYPYGYKFRARGEIVVKGKGLMETYFLMGHINRSIVEPADAFCELQMVQHHDPISRQRFVSRVSNPPMEVQKMDFITADPTGNEDVSCEMDSRLRDEHSFSSAPSSSQQPSASQRPSSSLPPAKLPSNLNNENVNKSALVHISPSPYLSSSFSSSTAPSLQDSLWLPCQGDPVMHGAEPKAFDSLCRHVAGALNTVQDGDTAYDNTNRSATRRQCAQSKTVVPRRGTSARPPEHSQQSDQLLTRQQSDLPAAWSEEPRCPQLKVLGGGGRSAEGDTLPPWQVCSEAWGSAACDLLSEGGAGKRKDAADLGGCPFRLTRRDMTVSQDSSQGEHSTHGENATGSERPSDAQPTHPCPCTMQ